MLRLPAFAYEAPTTIDQTVDLLARYGANATVVSGGTDLFPNMKQGLARPEVLIGLRRVSELRFLTYEMGSGLAIGALTTLQTLAASDAVRLHYPALAAAARSVSTPQLRSMGTVGGNLCLDTRCYFYNQQADWREALGYCLKKDGDVCRVAPNSARCLAVNSSDLAPVLQALDASVHITSARGSRVVKIADFYRDDGRGVAALESGEILTKIAVPAPKLQTRSAYSKLRARDAFDFPLAGIAVVVSLDGEGVCRDARLVLGALAPRPIEVGEARSALIGTRLEPRALAEAAECAYAAGKPMQNTASTLIYRKRMLRVYTYRALQSLTAGA